MTLPMTYEVDMNTDNEGQNLSDKGVKVFNVGDEFLVHTFKAYLAAKICTHLNLSSTLDNLPMRSPLSGFNFCRGSFEGDTHANSFK